MKIRDIFEARRNPHLNPKIDALDTFSMYANKPNMFVTFTQLPKVGINPQSNFRTPIGVYSYPLEYVLEKAYQSGTIFGSAPFASVSKYVHLFQQTSRNVLDVSTYSRSQFEKDIKKLYNYFDNVIGVDVRDFVNSTTSKYKELAHETGFSYGKRLWYLIYILIDNFTNESRVTVEATKILFRVLGYDAVYDLDGKGVIHQNEPTQAVHFNIRTIRVLETFSNKEMGQDRIEAHRERIDFRQIKSEVDGVLERYYQEVDMLEAIDFVETGEYGVNEFMKAYRLYIDFLDNVYNILDKNQDGLNYMSREDAYDLMKNINGFILNVNIKLNSLVNGGLVLSWMNSISTTIREWIYGNGTAEDVVDVMDVAVAGLKRPESQKRVMDSVRSFIEDNG